MKSRQLVFLKLLETELVRTLIPAASNDIARRIALCSLRWQSILIRHFVLGWIKRCLLQTRMQSKRSTAYCAQSDPGEQARRL